jgi:hypothetical protein
VSDFYTQSVILTNMSVILTLTSVIYLRTNVITTRTSVISTRTRLIFTRIRLILHAEYDFHTESVILHTRVSLTRMRVNIILTM